jgi:hypothetical protein
MDKKIIILINLLIITIILSVSNIFFAVKYISTQKKLNEVLAFTQTNDRIKFFNNVFIDKVLKARAPVSYEDRLILENAVMDTNDGKIIDQWHLLLESQTEAEAQKGVVDLLILFAR